MESEIFFSGSHKARLSKALDSLSENLADEGDIAFKMDHPFLTEKKAAPAMEVGAGNRFESFSQASASSRSNPDELDCDFDQKEAPFRAYQEPSSEEFLKELRFIVGKAIHGLQKMERLVVTLYYYEELTLKEIAMVLGVSESRASQLHTQAIIRLTNMLKNNGEPVFVN